LVEDNEDGYGCTVCCITRAADNPLGTENIKVSICNILNDDYVFYKLLDILFLLQMKSRTDEFAFLKKGDRNDVVTVGPTAAGPHVDSNGITISITILIPMPLPIYIYISNIRGRPRPRDPPRERGYCEAFHHRERQVKVIDTSYTILIDIDRHIILI
jgi:hypothetical protein